MSESNAYLISVLIPTFNAAAYLAETLDSVLMQDWPEIEVLVCDDGSADDSVEVGLRAGPRVRVEPGPHRGLAATRNRGIRLARGHVVLHLDADDLLQPGAISALARHLVPECDIVVGRLMSFISPDLPPGIAARYSVPTEPHGGHVAGTTLIRKAVFETHGFFDETYEIGADMAWFAAAQARGARIGRIDDVVLHRRIHGGNSSLNSRQQWPASVLRTVRAAMRQRRGND